MLYYIKDLVALAETSSSTGSSVGFDIQMEFSAIGETFERQFLYNEFALDGWYQPIHCKAHEKPFIDYIAKVTDREIDDDIRFPFTQCKNFSLGTLFGYLQFLLD